MSLPSAGLGAEDEPQAFSLRSAAIAKLKVENKAGCTVTARFFGDGFNANGKRLVVKPGKRKTLKLAAPGDAYTWTATGSCCADGDGGFDAPLNKNKKKNAPLVFACTPPIDTPFGLTSRAFLDGETIPDVYTCDGDNTSPPLAIRNVPSGTKSFVLILDDPDAPGETFTHWVLFDIPAGQATFPAGFEDGDYGISGLNDAARLGYFGACSPAGDDPHRYFFKLFALGVESLNLPEGATLEQVEAAMEDHILAQTVLLGMFARG